MTASERASAPTDRKRESGRTETDGGPTRRAAERLRRSRDFEAVMRHGRRTRDPIVHLAARQNELPYSRVGYAVSRRVGGAVARNRVKRRLRAIMRDLPIQTGYDIVALPQHSSADASFRELSAATRRCARKLKVTTAENDEQR